MLFSLNGELYPAGTSALTPDDRGLTLGDGAFETIAVRGRRPMRLAAHLDRLAEALAVLAIEPAPARDALESSVTAVIEANALVEGVVRLMVTRGPAPQGLKVPDPCRPSVVATAKAGLPPGDPVHAIVATRVRRNEHSPLTGIKSLSYADNVLARMEAAAAGADDALLLNTAGRLAEATAANVFIVREGRVLTPPLADGCLPGIARRTLLATLPAAEHPLAPGDLRTAEEVFLTASTGARPVTSIDGRAVAGGLPGSTTARARTILADQPDPA